MNKNGCQQFLKLAQNYKISNYYFQGHALTWTPSGQFDLEERAPSIGHLAKLGYLTLFYSNFESMTVTVTKNILFYRRICPWIQS